MDPARAGGVVLSLACGGAAAACLWQRMSRPPPLSEAERDKFKQECARCVEGAGGAQFGGQVARLIGRASLYGFSEERAQLVSAATQSIARQVRQILRMEDDPRHALRIAQLVSEMKGLARHGVPHDQQLAAHLSPEEVQRYHSWLAGMQRRGWVACLRLLASQFKPELLRLVADLAGGVLSLRITAGDADLMRALAQQEDTALLLPLATTVTLLHAANWMVLHYKRRIHRTLVFASQEKVFHHMVENLARADLVFLTEARSAVNVVRRDMQSFARCMGSVSGVLKPVGEATTLLFTVSVPLPQLGACVATAMAASWAVGWLNSLPAFSAQRRRKFSKHKEVGGRLACIPDLSALFKSTATVLTLRGCGQEVLTALAIMEEAEVEMESLPDTASVLLSSMRRMVEITVYRVEGMVGTSVFGPGLLFTKVARLWRDILHLRHGLQDFYDQTWIIALRIDLLLNLPRTIDLGDDVGLRCLEEPHTLDLEGVWFGYDAEDSEAEEEAVEGGEEGEEEEEEETSGSGGEQQKRKGAVLRGIDMHIEAGTHIGIAGPSGCGKSTLMALLSRLYDPQQGVVKLGGRPLSDYNVGWLRREVVCGSSAAMELVSGSIADNVRLSRPEATTEEVREALRAACAVDFVQEKGLMTRTQYDAPDLSSGQAARVLLARALVAKPKILVLDEVSAHLDPVIEDALRKELRALRQSGTTIINVSHRLSFLKDCDAVHVFGGGKIVASGRHKELLTQCAWYSDACQKQTLASRSMSY